MTASGEADSTDQALYHFERPLRDLPRPISLVILGATGSIGRQTLDLVRRFPDRLFVAAVTTATRIDLLDSLLADLAIACPASPPPVVAVVDPGAHARAAELPRLAAGLLAPGAAGLLEAVAAPDATCVVNGIVGAAGLAPTLAAAARGLRIALANKESLVVGGDLVRQAVRAGEAELLPVDSEHSAIAQCLVGHRRQEVAGLILTASGGPFRTTPRADLARVSRAEVLNHPTWNMGPKITVDSATLMNKGLEVIEAHHLFGLPYSAIEVVVHPGSHVHSLVTLCDGAVLAQLGSPDMRVPLLYAISGEKRWPLAAQRLDLVATGALHFEAPDLERFPCLRLAREAGEAGGSAPIVLNAANEVAVASLLAEQLQYLDIARVIERSLADPSYGVVTSLADALAIDTRARARAGEIVVELSATQP